MGVCRDRTFLLMVLVNPSSWSLADVILRLPSKIELGEPLKLDCEISNAIPATRSRQWRGGSYNTLLCFDGTCADPTKYIERIINQTNYELIVEKITENDLRCPYMCVVGFDSDQKFLEVNVNNFLHLPAEKLTKIDNKMQDGKISLELILKKVFPQPECELKMREANIYIPVANVQKYRVLLDVTYGLQLSDANVICGEILEVECQLGTKSFLILLENNAICKPPTTSKDSKTSLIVLSVSGIIVLCLVVSYVMSVIVKRIKENNRHTDEEISQNEVRHSNEEDNLMI